jgi:F0F1-type ATP synthase assembly protein I
MRLDPENPKDIGYFLGLSQAGIEMVVPVGIGVALDSYFNWAPWGAAVGAVLGLTIGLTHLVLMANRRDREDKSSRDPPRE